MKQKQSALSKDQIILSLKNSGECSCPSCVDSYLRAQAPGAVSRSVTGAAIAQLLYSQLCREENRPLARLQDADATLAERFRHAGERAVLEALR